MKNVLAILFSFIIASAAFAERPMVTETYKPVPKHKYRIDSGYSRSLLKSGLISSRIDTTVSYGYSEKIEIGLAFPYSRGASAFGDVHISSKYVLNESYDGGSSLYADYKVPTGGRISGSSSGLPDLSLRYLYSFGFGRFSCAANAGYTFVGVPKGSNQEDFTSVSVSGSYPVQELKLFVLSELIWSKDDMSLNTGIRYKNFYGFDLDAAYSYGMTNITPNIITFGFTKTIS